MVALEVLELGQQLAVSPATVVQMVDHREKASLVARERDPLDRRAYLLRLEPAAARVVVQVDPLGTAIMSERLGATAARTCATWSTCFALS